MRLLISIGCNSYDAQPTLTGAEKDADEIFRVLTEARFGDYDSTRSLLLLSPTIGQLKDEVRRILLSNKQIETLTFFFAGHGEVRPGAFYMLAKDSYSDALSLTAYALTDLLLAIADVSPAQSNIIIDACQSGGLVSDLNVLLKSTIVGNAGSPGVTIFAASAQDEGASETDDGGFGTIALLKCIKGDDFVQDHSPTLDLVEIGRSISRRMHNSGSQTPVVWGLNLWGPPSFCRNPRYAQDPTQPLRDFMRDWPNPLQEGITNNYEALWEGYLSAGANWSSKDFSAILRNIFAQLSAYPDVMPRFVERLDAAFVEQSAASDDLFRPAQITATVLSCLLPHLRRNGVRDLAQRLVKEVGTRTIEATTHLISDLHEDKFAILSRKHPFSDLFYLPIRISDILGLSATATLAFDQGDSRRSTAEDQFCLILRFIVANYPLSICCISDRQAAAYAVVLSQAVRLGLTDEAECILGLLFTSLVECGGNIARHDIEPDAVASYLIARGSSSFSDVLDLVERPSQISTVILKAADTLNLNDEFDCALWKLDKHSLLAYFPSSYNLFNDRIMIDGRNVVWTIGRNVFRIRDLGLAWPQQSYCDLDSVDTIAAILSSLLFPDRVMWPLLDWQVQPPPK